MTESALSFAAPGPLSQVYDRKSNFQESLAPRLESAGSAHSSFDRGFFITKQIPRNPVGSKVRSHLIVIYDFWLHLFLIQIIRYLSSYSLSLTPRCDPFLTHVHLNRR